jgi:predicted dehydrogenase
MAEKEKQLLRIGVLGAGPIAQAAHFEACRKARNAELYAICDLASDLVTEMAAVHHPCVYYLNYAEMLADPHVDAVIIATADQFHVAMAVQALAAGKHVLVEKPMGVNVEECEALRQDVLLSGKVLQVGTMKRFDPGIAFARQFIQEEIGELLALKAWYCDSTYRYTETDNLQPQIVTSANAKRPSGNPKADKQRYYLLGHASHLVDTARFLAGEIVKVRARLVEKFGAYTWFVDTEFANGAIGHLDLTVAVRMDWHEGFQVYGEYGSVIGKTFNPWYKRSSEVECSSIRDDLIRRPIGADGFTYRRQIEGFADTILNGAPMLGANIDDGLAALRALVAISRSVESGDWVCLADVSGGL